MASDTERTFRVESGGMHMQLKCKGLIISAVKVAIDASAGRYALNYTAYSWGIIVMDPYLPSGHV